MLRTLHMSGKSVIATNSQSVMAGQAHPWQIVSLQGGEKECMA